MNDTNRFMHTLRDIAAINGLYMRADIPQRWLEIATEYTLRTMDIPPHLLDMQARGLVEVGQFWSCETYKDEHKEYISIEHSHVLVKSTGSDLICRLSGGRNWNDGKHTLHPHYTELHKFRDISSYKKTDAVNVIKQPHQIGVWTDKKVMDWLGYCETYVAVLNTLLQATQEGNAKIESQIATFIGTLLPGCDVKRWGTEMEVTTVKTHLFTVRFEHTRASKYLHTKIEFEGDLQAVSEIHKLVGVKKPE